MPSPYIDYSQSAKFKDPKTTAKGERRAWVHPTGLETVWFNTGTLCNLECSGCYIESSPRNDRLVYITAAEVERYLDEAKPEWGLREVGLTGGEPFLNPHLLEILELSLERGYEVLLLTNAMIPMQRKKPALLQLRERYGSRLTLRVSLDHFRKELHEKERGTGSWDAAIAGLRWLSSNGFAIDVAGRTLWNEDEQSMRAGYAALFEAEAIDLDAADPKKLMLFPEMDMGSDVPEITTACWDILGVKPEQMMCSKSRMVVKRKGAEGPSVAACTLLPYDEAFDLGPTLEGSLRPVSLNHPYCAQFCVLGGASCSAG